MQLTILGYLMIYLAAMVLVVPLAKRFGLGAVLGYLLAGVMIGPSGFALTSDNADISLLAELGVVLMLFTIGLELDAEKLWAMRKHVFIYGCLQMLSCGLGVAIAMFVFGFAWPMALLLGVTLALSSTAVAVQLMKDRNLLSTETGQSVFAVLLFQDLAAIPLLIGLSFVVPSSNEVAFNWLSALAAIAIVILVGRYLMNYLLNWVATYGARELFVALALLFVIGVMQLMLAVGISAGLGAFIAGVLLASSAFKHQLEADLEPFKGLFLGLFFITIGADINVALLIAQWPMILALLVGYLALKISLLYLVARLQNIAAPERLRYAVLLGQGGEFAFVIVALLAGVLVDREQSSMLNLVIALSMALSPLLLVLQERYQQRAVALQSDDNANRDAAMQYSRDNPPDQSPVIIAGFGRYGQIIGRLLLANGITPTIMDHDSARIEHMRQFGFNVYYGDARRMDLLDAAGAAEAKVLIIAMHDVATSLAIARVAKQHYPELCIMSRAVDVNHLYQLRQLGIRFIQRELFESSLLQGRDVLAQLGLGLYEAKELVDRFRAKNIELLTKLEQNRDTTDEKGYFQLLQQSREELKQQLEQELRSASDRER
jgi:glutathione-regulated potassium-efflux system ancillary protein KefC